jgi:hypothetical protein
MHMENLVETRKGMMVEKLETRSAPALAAINAFVRGSSARLCSSNKLGWDGVYLEHHRMFPGERNDSVSTHHLVVLCTSHVARGETSWEHARFVAAVSALALIIMAAPDMSLAHDGIKPQRTSDNSRRGSFGFYRIISTG